MIRSRRVVPACLIFALALIAGACVTPTNPGNRAPIAAIEASETSGPAPLTVEFSSAGSSDPDGTIASYQWSFGDGSEGSTLPAPTHTFTTSGTFTVTLTVTDNAGATGVATVEITVDPAVNQPPEAAFTASRTSGPAPLVVDFDASGSSDPDGDIATYEWEFGDGGTATGETASHTFMNEGSYVVQLTVTDDAGATASATETIVVSSNQPPTAAAAADPTSGKAPLVVNLSSAGSSDPEGGSLTYSWNFGDGSPLSSEANPTHTYAAGSYTATLTVTDPAGLSDTATVAIEAVENQPPVAVANATPSAGQVPVTINFSSAGSTDNDGTIVSYHWDFDDGTFSTQANPSHTYATVGTYTVTLTVTDDNGAAASATVTVEANPIPNVPPTAAASGSPLSGTHPLIVNFSSAGSSDSDGTIVAYDWDFGDGTSSTQANPSHTYTTAGTFTATLRVTDNAGGQATATVGPIEVAVNQPPTAAASGTPTSGKAPLTVVFSSAGTSDPENQTLSYAWDFGDGGSSTVANPSRTYTSPGTFTARLTVTDPAGNTDEATVVIAVAANQAPTAVVNAWPQSGPRALVVNFNGSSSSDPDGTIASYSWTFGDGGTSTAANPVHTYNSAGTFTATLTVTDDDGATDSEGITITVYIDDDEDGFPLSDDCDDENPAIHPGAADPLDDAGIDQDCDGVDGVLDDTVFVATGGSDAATCTIPSDPCATISGGAQRAATLGRSVIQIANGTYGRFQALSGRTFRGGYAPGFTTRSGTTTVAGSLDGIHGYYGVRIVGTSAPTTVADMTINAGGASGAQSNGVIVAGSTANVALRNLNVTGGTGTNPSGVFLETSLSVSITGSTIQSGTATGAGSSAYGVRAVSSNVTITSSSVSASAGVAGAGSTATPATSPAGCNGNHGANASGPSSPGNGGASCGGSGVGTAGAGGRGGDYSSAGTNGTAGGGGAPGGVGGCGSLFGCGDPRPGGGGGGAPGSGGTSGSGGTNTTNNAGALWVGANGGVGGNGGTGGGGGGGGGGKSASASGGGGGGGGAGGTGGAGGSTPGAHGGGSFAVYAFNSHVNLIGVVATASSGGAGGRGSNGGAGGKGGNGGNGGDKSCCEASGGGGGGGAGGGGGGGGAGGGAGGPSIAVFHKGTGILSISGGQRNRAASAAAGGPGGTAGGGGARGEAGAAGNNPNFRSNPHPGTPGNPGTAGSNGGSGAAGLIYRVWDNGAFVN